MEYTFLYFLYVINIHMQNHLSKDNINIYYFNTNTNIYYIKYYKLFIVRNFFLCYYRYR